MRESQGHSGENNAQTPVGNNGGHLNNEPLPDLNMPPPDLDVPVPNNVPAPNANMPPPGLNAPVPNNPPVADFNAPVPNNPPVMDFNVPVPNTPPVMDFNVPVPNTPPVMDLDEPGPSNPLVPHIDVPGLSNPLVPNPSRPLGSIIKESIEKYYGKNNLSEDELANILKRYKNIDQQMIDNMVSHLEKRHPEIFRAFECMARHQQITNLAGQIQGASTQSSVSNFPAPPAAVTSGNNSDDLGNPEPVGNISGANNNSPGDEMRSATENHDLQAPLPERDSSSTDDGDSSSSSFAPADG